jgi:hypothetical protein
MDLYDDEARRLFVRERAGELTRDMQAARLASRRTPNGAWIRTADDVVTPKAASPPRSSPARRFRLLRRWENAADSA